MTISNTALRIVFALSVLAIPHLAQAQSFNAGETVAVNQNQVGTDLVGVNINNNHMTTGTIAVNINNNHQPVGGFGS